MLDKLEAIKARFEQVGIALTNPEIINNQAAFGKLSKEFRALEKIEQPFEEYKKVLNEYQFVKDNLNSNDEDMKELAKMELPQLEEMKETLEKTLTQLLIPKDPQDDKNAILEIRAGTGGDEASLFAGDLLGIYLRYCAKKGWKTAIVSESEGTAGGYKEVVVEVTGEDVYGTLRFESVVHRVQRVPANETQGRVHTSAATVAVIP
jgi:peptide chain release factor 1